MDQGSPPSPDSSANLTEAGSYRLSVYPDTQHDLFKVHLVRKVIRQFNPTFSQVFHSELFTAQAAQDKELYAVRLLIELRSVRVVALADSLQALEQLWQGHRPYLP